MGGALQCGKTSSAMSMLQYASSSTVLTIDMISISGQNDCISLQNFVAVHIIRRVLVRGAADDSILAGWSLGASRASTAASFLHASLSVFWAVTMLDDRSSIPHMRLISHANAHASVAERLESC